MTKRRKHRKSVRSKSLLGTKNVLLHFVRLLIGLLFVFSGFVKAVDPLGTVYKIEDYLIAFGGFWNSLIVLAFPAALCLIAFELFIGLNLLLQVRFRPSVRLALVFMLILTPLTLYIAVYNPVSDCGCFGDAVKISNQQTFYKNLVLLVLILILIIFQKKFRQIYQPYVEWILMSVFVFASFAFMIYNFNHLPLIDFRPYKIGVNIPEAMHIPDDAPVDEYEYNLIYEKDGVRKTFTLTEIPDSSWTFISQETKLIKEGYKPPIHDFTVLTAEYEDITEELVNFKGRTYMVIVYDLSKTSEKGMQKVKSWLEKQTNPKVKVYALTASSSSEIREFKKQYGLSFPFYKTDPITLKTMIRANPGVIKIENGIIKDKWNGKDQ